MNMDMLIRTLEDANFEVGLAEGGTELVIACPLCYDEKPRLYISAATGLWTCFHCDARGHLTRLLRDVCELTINESYTLERLIHQGDSKPLALTVTRPTPPSTVELPAGFFIDPGTGLAASYFQSRGLRPSWVQELRAGFCMVGPYACRIIIPVITQGKLRTFVARSWLPEEKKKVLMPPGSQASRALFGYDQLVTDRAYWKKLILVEGVFDTIRMWEHGYRETVATLGVHTTELQRNLVKRLRPESVILLRDGDDAGREGAIKEARELAYAMINVEIAQLPEGKDPDSATRDEVREALDNATEIALDYGAESVKSTLDSP